MRLTMKEKLGYSSAGITDSANFTFMGSYILFFLTTIAHINPVTAGALIAVGSVISSLWGPIVGFLSDHIKTKFGRRRPFLMAASVPLAVSMVLCFTDIQSAELVRNIYYGVMIVLFWCSFSSFYTPWLALGAEYTTDYSERTELRSVTYAVTLAGTVFGIAVPPIAIDWFCKLGFSETKAWQIMALIIAVIAFIAINITIRASARKDVGTVSAKGDAPKRKLQAGAIASLVKEYWEVLKLKPMLFVIGACLCQITAQGIFFSDRLYFFTYNLGLSAGESTAAMIMFPISGAIILVPILKVTNKLDKRSALILFLLIAAAGCVVMDRIVGINSFAGVVALTFVFVIGNSAFWQLMPVMIYDVCEYDEYQNNKRREGIIVSIQTIMETICSGLATFVLGAILQFTGFDETAMQQTETALGGVEFALAIVPALLMVGCAFMAYKYPITKDVFRQLKEAVAKRNAGDGNND